VSAWKRRLLIITLSAASKHREVIGEYAKKMFASEAEGVLYRMVQGAFDHLEELKVRAEFGLHPAQVARVDALLAESQSIEMFLKAKVVKRAGEELTSEQLAKGYADYCEEQGWEALELKKVQRELPSKMFGLFGTHLVNGVEDPNTGKRVRGYRNVAFAGEEPEDDRRQYADVPPECAEDMFK
jgi:phage/plasmid-associated DNA primase